MADEKIPPGLGKKRDGAPQTGEAGPRIPGDSPSAPPARGEASPSSPPPPSEKPETELERIEHTISRITQHVPARVRKFIFSRVAAELFLIALVVLAAAAWFVRTETFKDYARRFLEAEATIRLRRPVTVGDVRASIVPPSITFSNVSVANDPRAWRKPFFRADELTFHLDLIPFDYRGAKLQSIVLTRPELRLTQFEDGTWNVPDLAPSKDESPAKETSIEIERIQILQGSAFVNEKKIAIGGDAAVTAEWKLAPPGNRHELSLQLRARLSGKGTPIEIEMGKAHLFLSKNLVDIRELEIVSPAGKLIVEPGTVEVGAKIARGRIPFSGRVEAGALDRFAKLDFGLEGEVGFEGALEFDRVGPRLQAQLHAKEFRAGGAKLEAVRASLDARPHQAALSLRESTIGGGKLTGDITGDPAGPLKLSLHGGAIDAAALEVFLPASTPRVGSKANLEAEITGELDSPEKWSGPLVLDLEPSPGAAGLPLTLHLNTILDGRITQIRRFDFQTPFIEFHAGGAISWDGPPADLRVSFGISDLTPSSRLLASVLDTAGLYSAWILPVSGNGTSEATITTGRDVIFKIDGRADLEDAFLEKESLGHVTGRLSYDIHSIRFENAESKPPDGSSLRAAGQITNLDGDGSVALDLDVSSERFPADSAIRMLRLDFLRIAGLSTGRLQLHGPVTSLDGGGTLALERATFWDQKAARISGKLLFEKSSLRLEGISGREAGGTFDGDARFDADGEHLEFQAKYSKIPLLAVEFLSSHVPEKRSLIVSGKATGTGTYASPHVSIAGQLVGGTFVDELPEKSNLPYTFSMFDHRFDFSMTGPGGLAAKFEAPIGESAGSGSWSIAATDLEPYSMLVGIERGDVAFGGSVALHGSLTIPSAPLWNAEGTLDDLRIDADEATIRLAAPSRITMDSNRLRLDPARFSGNAGDVTFGGSLLFDAARTLQARLAGRVDATFLDVLAPEDVLVEGGLLLNLQTDGSIFQPSIFGSIDVNGGKIQAAGLPRSLDEITGRLDLRSGRLTTESVTARYGEGTLRLFGTSHLDGFVPSDFRARVEVNKIQARVEGLDLVGDGQILVSGDLDHVVMRGEIDLSRALYTEDFSLKLDELLGRTPKQVVRAGVYPWMDRVELEMRLRAAAGNLAVRNNLAHVSGEADLALRGTLGHPSLLGQVTVLEGGEVEFQDVKYEVLSGTIFFSDPLRIDPVFDITAQADIRPYLVRLNITGTLTHFTPTFTSDPPLTESNILYLLLSGQTLDDSNSGPSRNPEQRITTATEKTITSLTLDEVNRRGKQLFGLDRFTIDPVFNENQLDTARITIGKKISKDLTVTYTYSPQSKNQEQLLLVEYRLRSRAYLQGTWDDKGILGFDLKIRSRY